MDDLNTPSSQEDQTVIASDNIAIGLLPCCAKTLRMHAAFNPMMVCSECKQIIKCFREERPYRNYVAFCQSRHRKIFATKFEDQMVVIFRTYGNFS